MRPRVGAKTKAKGRKHVHYTLDLKGCPRCGGDHEGMIFTPLSNPEGPEDLWAFCDAAGEPVLLSSEEVG